MAERRTLAATMTNTVPGVDDELVRSFVTQNQTSERHLKAAPKRALEEGQQINASSEADANSSDSQPRPKKSSRLHPVGLIPITVRLRPVLAGALKRASLERELQGADFYTQQDLIEQVLEPWLRREGYIS